MPHPHVAFELVSLFAAYLEGLNSQVFRSVLRLLVWVVGGIPPSPGPPKNQGPHKDSVHSCADVHKMV